MKMENASLLGIFLLLTSSMFMIPFSSVSQELFIDTSPESSLYRDGWIDLNKNGEKDPYEDPSMPVEKRVDDLLGRMTLEEKTCQLVTLYGYGRVAEDELPVEEWKKRVWKDGLGNIDEHLNGLAYNPQAKTEYSWPPSKHARAINQVQQFFIEETRLGIPVDFTNEGIRGLTHHGATGFPADIGLGSSWDRDLVNQVGHVTGREAKVLGYTNIYSPILDLARDPRWGRVVETYGEDPYLVSQYGKQMVEGLQDEGVASTLKHYAVYSVPKGGRDGEARTDPHVAPREMRQMYLEPFRVAVEEAGALGVMSSYNDYDAIPVTASHRFLVDILRDQWGFDGYVVSDSWAVGGLEGRHHVADDYKECVRQAVNAGLNIKTHFEPPKEFVMDLRELVKQGKVSQATLDERVRDVLRVKFTLGLFDSPYVGNPGEADEVVHTEAHEETALRASRESLVLLKNEGLLPVDPAGVGSVLVTGPNADAEKHSISRYGPSHIDVVSVLEGIRGYLGDSVDVRHEPGCKLVDDRWPESELYDHPVSGEEHAMIRRAVEQAGKVDVVFCVLGENQKLVGESKSRTSLDLPGNQRKLIQALHEETNTPVVGILINGRAMSVNWMDENIPAVLEAWFPGQYGGQAVAEALFGEYSPSGKLPVTFPRTVGQLPYNFPYKPRSQVSQSLSAPENFIYTRVSGALYPFGYGKTYTSFDYSNLTIEPRVVGGDEKVTVSCTIENTGSYRADAIPQLYLNDKVSSVVTYTRELRGFERIGLVPGEKKRVEFTVHPKEMAIINRQQEQVVEPGIFEVAIGRSSQDIVLEGRFRVK
jgi:beta-glucosidase